MHAFGSIAMPGLLRAIATAIALTGSALGAPVTWVGANGGFWDVTGNWSPGIPTAADDALLGAFNTVFRSTSGTLPINSFSGTGTLTISGGALTIANTSATGGFTMSGGSLVGPGDLTVNGAATITFGDHHGAGTTFLKSPSTISSSGLRLDGGRILQNESSLIWSGGQLLFNNTVANTSSGPGSGTIHNMPAATFTASGDGAASITASSFGAGDDGSDALFTNDGAFVKSGSTAGNTTNIFVKFDNPGSVSVQTGILSMTHSNTYAGSFSNSAGAVLLFTGGGAHTLNGPLSVAGTLRISNATLSFGSVPTLLNALDMQGGGALNLGSSNVTLSTLNQSGGSIKGPGDLTINGAATITYGDHQGAGTTHLKSPSTISSSGFRLDSGRTLQNESSLTWTGGQLLFNNTVNNTSSGPGSGTISNVQGATFTASGDSANAINASFFAGDDGTDALFSNAGTFVKSGSASTSQTTFSVKLDNLATGSVDVQTGILNLTKDSSYAGSFSTAPGAVLLFSGGNHTLNGPVNSAGTLRLGLLTTLNFGVVPTLNALDVQGGVLNLGTNNVTVTTLNQTTGSIAGPGDLTVNGTATISFGDHHGGGTTFLKSPSTISSSGFRLDSGRTLRNESSLMWTAGGLTFNNTANNVNSGPGSGTIVNAAGATFTASGNTANIISASVQAGDNGSDALFTNAGTFIKTASTAAHQTTISVAFDNTGTVDVQTGILKLPDNFTNNGTLKGVGTYATTALNNAGHVAPGESPGTLTLNGNFTQAANGFLDTELVNIYAFDKFVVSGTATLGGTLALQCNGCAVRTDDEYVILQSTGTLSGTFASVTVTGFGVGFAHRVVYDYAGHKVKIRILDSGALPGLTVFKRGSGSGTVTSGDVQIDCGFVCSHAYANGSMVTLTATPAAGSTFTGWLGACIGIGTCNVTVGDSTAVTATFSAGPIVPKLDVDLDNQASPLTDGLLILRYMFGVTGSNLTTGALGATATRTDPAILDAYLIDIAPYLDADGNGDVDALTDGVLILRYLMNLVDPALTLGAVGPGATRSTGAAVATHLGTLMP